MNKNNHPLSYFKSILEEHSLESLKNKTIQDFELSRGSDIKTVDLEKGIVKYIAVFYDPIKDDRVEALATYNFYNEFGLILKTKEKEAILNLDGIVNEFTKEGHSPIGYLNNINQELLFLMKKAEKKFSAYPKTLESLEKISSYLSERYGIKVLPRDKKESNVNSFFGIKPEIKLSLIEQLYNIAEELQIINYEVVELNTFIEVLTENPKDDSSIRFNCNNQLAVHFIKCIQPLFFNFNFSQIDKSKRFYSKQGTLLKQTNLDVADSQLKKKPSEKIQQISLAINSLLESI